MHKTTISSVLIALLLVSAGTSQSLADWNKSFNGTRDQVRAACTGPGMVLNEWSDTHATSCTNQGNGNAVVCNDNGQCTGTGPGPMPRLVASNRDIIGTFVGAKRSAPQDTSFIYGDPHSGQSGDPAPAASGSRMGQWYPDAGGIILGGGIFANH